MPTDLIRYDLLVQDALRAVVRRVLSDAARNGLPGEHHFNISFKTQAPGVALPAAIRQKYPDEMTIILQHEFWDLAVEADGFEVSLNFSRRPERLKIPFDAIVGFSDPSVPFGFKLEPREQAAASAPALEKQEPPPAPLAKPQPAPLPAPAAKPAASGASRPAAGETRKTPEKDDATKVVSIDAFRKK
ncbi:MAG TPA: ClpXP protease specificity-enhancing factor SspB [Roseiarcus sp.]|nr:ClpXP protease specificity-enhancing factor SspB [Roseiarcus sp.]